MSTHLLIADAGHTRIKLAHCRLDRASRLPQVVNTVAIVGDRFTDWQSVASWFSDGPPDAVIVTGTNLKKAQALVDDWPPVLPPPILLTDRSLLPIAVDVDFPEKVGIDRLLNAVAANVLRDPQQPAITIDTGTAVTVDVVNGKGVFMGGAILPGILMEARALHDFTTTLPEFDAWQLLSGPPDLIGRNTRTAIASGLYWGHLGAVRELVDRYTEHLRSTGQEPPLVLLTGGAAGILSQFLTQARHEPALSLQGLALAGRHLASRRKDGKDGCG